MPSVSKINDAGVGNRLTAALLVNQLSGRDAMLPAGADQNIQARQQTSVGIQQEDEPGVVRLVA
jgi:hypothetical protein